MSDPFDALRKLAEEARKKGLSDPRNRMMGSGEVPDYVSERSMDMEITADQFFEALATSLEEGAAAAGEREVATVQFNMPSRLMLPLAKRLRGE